MRVHATSHTGLSAPVVDGNSRFRTRRAGSHQIRSRKQAATYGRYLFRLSPGYNRLTVPAILLIGLFTGQNVLFGLNPVDSILLATSLIASMLTFSTTRTNIIHGIVHLILFVTYLVMVFDWILTMAVSQFSSPGIAGLRH